MPRGLTWVRSAAGEDLCQGACSIRTVAMLDALVLAEAGAIRRPRPPSRRASSPHQASKNGIDRSPTTSLPRTGEGGGAHYGAFCSFARPLAWSGFVDEEPFEAGSEAFASWLLRLAFACALGSLSFWAPAAPRRSAVRRV